MQAIPAADLVAVVLATEASTVLGLSNGEPGERTNRNHVGSSTIKEIVGSGSKWRRGGFIGRLKLEARDGVSL